MDENMGIFDGIKWLIIWRSYRYTVENIERLEQLIKYYTQDKSYPILMGVDLGHTDPMVTIRYLSNVLLDWEKDLFILNYMW